MTVRRKGRLYIIYLWVFSLLLLFRVSDCADDCHSGVVVNGVCYFLGSQERTWLGAESACNANGGHLAAVTDSNVQISLMDMLKMYRIPNAWIGLYEQTGLWSWEGIALQPQGCYKDDPFSRDLATSVYVPFVTAESCIDTCKYSSYGPFMYAGTQNGEDCFCGNSFGRHGTEKVCTVLCKGNTTNSISNWCGGIDMNFIYRIEGAYGSFGYHQPNNHAGYQHCGIVDLHIETKMADEDCRRPIPYICDTESPECNNPGYHKLSNANEDCVYVGTDRLNHFRAEVECKKNHNGHLLQFNEATISESREKHLATKALLDNLYPDKDQSKFWIGAKKSTFLWSMPGAAFEYTSFVTNYPQNATNECIKLATVNNSPDQNNPHSWNYGWKDESCRLSLPYICQGGTPPAESTVTPTSPTTSARTSTSTIPKTTRITSGQISLSSRSNTNIPFSTSSSVSSSSFSSSFSFSSQIVSSSPITITSTPMVTKSTVPASQPIKNITSTTPRESGNGVYTTVQPSTPSTSTTSTSSSSGPSSSPSSTPAPTPSTSSTSSTPSSSSSSSNASPSSSASTSSTTSSSPTTSRSTPTKPSSPTSRSTPTTRKGGGGSGGDATTLAGPNAGAATGEESGLSLLEILLIVLLGILALVVLVVIIVLCCVFCKGRKHKVYAKGYDARPIAPVPNSGMEPNYEDFASTLSLNKYGPY